MQSYIHISLSMRIDVSELAGRLMNENLMGAWEDEGIVHLYWNHADWQEQVLDRLCEILQELGVKVSRDAIHVQTIPWQNWNLTWTDRVQPIRIGRRIIVRPSWKNVDITDDEIELILDPRQAFGTGHHVTTQLLCEWLEEIIQGGEEVLDVGTGSGLLGMVALRLGAKSVLGIDHDAIAIECAQDYARVNHFGPELEFQTIDLAEVTNGVFDVILANIDRETLLSVDGAFANIAGLNTKLLITGILECDEEDLITYYRGHGWVQRKVRKREGWIAVEFLRVKEDY